MPSRSNKHIKKFNQLVEVYEPDGVEEMSMVSSREPDALETRRDELGEYRERVEALEAADFFDEERRREIRESENLPAPADVADSQREEMLERVELIDDALADTIDDGEVLDTTDELDL